MSRVVSYTIMNMTLDKSQTKDLKNIVAKILDKNEISITNVLESQHGCTLSTKYGGIMINTNGIATEEMNEVMKRIASQARDTYIAQLEIKKLQEMGFEVSTREVNGGIAIEAVR